MTSINSLLKYFDFSVRQLAEALHISHSQMLNIVRYRRNPSPQLQHILAHPLFAQIDTDYNPDTEKDPAENEWIMAQLRVAQGKLLTEKTKLLGPQEAQHGALKIIHHTRQLDADSGTPKDLVVAWWQWQRSKALLLLEVRRPLNEWKQEKKVYLLEKEVEYLRNKLSGA